MIDSKSTLVAFILCVLIGIICIIVAIFSNNNIERYEYGNTYIVHQKDVNTGDKIDLKFSDGTKQAEIL